jgi:hypothetical protein
MLRKITITLSLAFIALLSYSQATIIGKVIDDKGEPVPFANVVIKQNGLVKTGASTDFDGEFKISNLDGGTYDVEVSYVGFNPYKLEGVKVSSGKVLPLATIKLSVADELPVVEVVAYKVPLIDKDAGASGGTVTREDIARMPGRSAASIAATVGGVQSDANGNITSVRGSRDDASYYFIDGIKVRGSSSLPKSAIEEVSVMTGGLPANYGDATGGIISITTRGASSQYFGGLEYVTSGFKIGDNRVVGLDRFGFNLLEGVISGPLLSKKDSTGKKGDPILGFFVSGNFTHQVDPRPFAIDQYRLKPEVRDALLDPEVLGPLRIAPGGVGTLYNSDFLTPDDFEKVKFRQNVASTAVSLAGKIDVNAGPTMNLTFGGSGNFNRRNVTDGSEDMLMNYTNNPQVTDFDWRVYGKFTQRFQSQQEGDKKGKGVSNAYYTIMVDYSKGTQINENETHRDNIFNYGYVGKFETELIPSYEFRDYDGNGTVDRVHNGFQEVEVTFTPSDVNQELAAVTNHYYQLFEDNPEGNYENLNQIINGGALINGGRPRDIYNVWRNIGYTYNGYGQSDNSQFRVTAMGSADIGDHAISLGFEFEQRTDRSFSASPVGLWTQMRQLANNHISELDESKVNLETFGSFFSYTFERLNADPGDFDGQGAQAFFDYNLRQALGYDPDGTAFIDLDALDPNLFTLSMFSADELLNNGQQLVSYFGYDHTGKKLTGKPSFDDFFTKKDEFGNFTREVGAFEPIYIAGYIMDKFAFNDLIFNVGVRVDRFDANQQVLKDRFLLYPARTLGEVSQIGGNEVTHPTSLPSDAVVYVNDINDPTAVSGYRVGSVWYNSLGQEIADPSTIYAASGIAPYLAEGVDPNKPISSEVFRDYKPQINVMPRVAFSFPISDEALFFAHYDVLTKRPTTGNRLDPFDYFYMRNRNEIINNPDLRPEKTIDYELGFQQVLTKKSSLKISGFYREQRDQVTLINTLGAYPVTYRTWGNIDFGTIKGLTLAYDLRKSGNISLRASYTLQFAEGTGSEPAASQGLINSGQPNLRTIFPYSYDQRHQMTLAMDYRYGEGKDYNGPVVGGKQILKNMGANLTANFASGTPYSAQENILPGATITTSSGILDGSVNGSRKPWNFRADLQIDRNIILKFGEEKKKSANLNVYLLVSNLFNTRNILNVYRATGNSNDDGYLNAAEWQNQINSQNDVDSYRYYYAMKMDSPFNYGIPRTIRLGVKLDF